MTADSTRATATGQSRSTRREILGADWFATLTFYVSLAVLTTIGAIRAIGLDRNPLGVPLNYHGDALSGGSSFKNVMEHGWYEYNPDLGAPWGQHFHDFPLADNLHLMIAHVLGWFTDQWAVAFNVYYLITFPLAALAGAWFVRLVGGSRTAAFAVGILFAFAPYHFQRNENHLYLAAYYPHPLTAGLVYRVLAGTPLRARRASGRRLNPLSWATKRTLWTVLILALVGTASSYYSIFTLLFLVASTLAVVVLRQRWRAFGGALVAMLLLMVVMLANMAPDLVYVHGKSTNFIGLTRDASSTEVFSLKLAALVLPVNWERIGPLAAVRKSYDDVFPLPSENPQLGFVAAVGFLFLLAVVLVAVLRGRTRIEDEGRFWMAQRQLAFLTLFGFLVGTVGGLSTLFALVVTGDVRGWNRISIYLAIFALGSIALVFDRAVARLVDRPFLNKRSGVRFGVVAVVAALATAVGLYDQVPPVDRAMLASQQAAWKSDAAYVEAIEARVPANTMIFQLPYVAFPESPPVQRLQGSDPLRPYLHSSDLRWSFGGIRGRPRADWADQVSADPAPRLLVELGAAHFGGIHVDRDGYTRTDDRMLEARLTRLLGVRPVVSPSKRFAFFDMTPYNRGLAARYPAAELTEIGSHTVAHPVWYWQKDYFPPVTGHSGLQTYVSRNASPRMYIDNPRRQKTAVQVSFTLTAGGSPARVLLEWPDGYAQTVRVGEGSAPFSRSIQLPTGRTSLTLSPAPGTRKPKVLHLNGWSVTDRVLTSFDVR